MTAKSWNCSLWSWCSGCLQLNQPSWPSPSARGLGSGRQQKSVEGQQGGQGLLSPPVPHRVGSGPGTCRLGSPPSAGQERGRALCRTPRGSLGSVLREEQPCTDQPPAAASPGPRSARRQVPSCPAAGGWAGPRRGQRPGTAADVAPLPARAGAGRLQQAAKPAHWDPARWDDGRLLGTQPSSGSASARTRHTPQHLEPARNSRRGDGEQLTASTRGQRGDNAPFLDGSRLRSEAEPESRACREPPSRGTSVLPARRDPPRTDGAVLAGRSSGRGLLASRFFPDSIFPYNLNDSCCNNKQAARRITSHFPARAKNLAAWPFFGCFPSNPSAQTEVGQFCASGMGR